MRSLVQHHYFYNNYNSTIMSTAVDQHLNREVTFTRTFNAPRPMVFRAWTEPEQLAKWWGPFHFTNPVCEVDAHKGGKLFIQMTGPDGTAYPMTAIYNEVREPEYLEFTSTAFRDAEGNSVLDVLTSVSFKEVGDKTELTVRATITKLGEMALQAAAGMEEGWKQSLVRFGQFLNGEAIS